MVTSFKMFECKPCQNIAKRQGQKLVSRKRVETHNHFLVGGIPQCSLCGNDMWEIGNIQGTIVESVPCDAKCHSAKGIHCECSCGGMNHGKVWS